MNYPRTRARWMLILALVVISVGTTLSSKQTETLSWAKKKCPDHKCNKMKIQKHPKCVDGQQLLPVNVQHDDGSNCYCVKPSCLMISCKAFKFDKDRPKLCPECKKANETDNCGCKTWVCEPKECKETKDPRCKTESCWKMESKTDSCGCPRKTCSVPKVEDDCGEENTCKHPCQECKSIAWPNKKCFDETAVTKKVCVPKKCGDLSKCSECEEAVDGKDSCGCPKRTCKPLTVTNKDFCQGNCDDAHCTVIHNRKCNTTVKTCTPCKNVEPKPCGKCEEPKTTIDERGCPIQTCEVPTADGQICNNCDRECNDCVEQVSCTTNDGRKATRMQCVPKQPQHVFNCTPCQIPTTTTHTCGFKVHGCMEKKCKELAPFNCKSVGQCPKKVKDECDCDVVECKPPPVKNNNGERLPKPANARCTKKCSSCHTCKWVWNPTCQNWEESCEHACAPYRIPDSPACYEEQKVDICGCTIPGDKKACTPNRRGDCPPEKPYKYDGKDDCGCSADVCVSCPPPGDKVQRESDCTECQTFQVDEDANPECPIGVCVPKECPTTVGGDCGDCKVAKIVKDKCGCSTKECVKDCKPLTPKDCGEGKVQKTSRNSCGCEINICEKCDIGDPECTTTITECKCEQRCKEPTCKGECVAQKMKDGILLA